MDFDHYPDHALSLVEGLINSHTPAGVHVTIDTPGGLAGFLRAYGFPMDGAPARRDLEEVDRLRARLRIVFESNDPREQASILNTLLEETGVRPRLATHHGSGWHIDYVPVREPLPKRLAARAAMALATVVAEEGFQRLRVCEWETCSDVFVDRSRNRSRRFCSPEVCGNRAAAAAWRARKRIPPPTSRGRREPRRASR